MENRKFWETKMDRNSSLSGKYSLSTSNLASSPVAESTRIAHASPQTRFPWNTRLTGSFRGSPRESIFQRSHSQPRASPINRIDPRTYTDVQSKGLTSRLIKYHEDSQKLNRSSSVGCLYNRPGQFPIINLKRNEIRYSPRRNQNISMVRIAPPGRSIFEANTRSSILRSGSIVPSVVSHNDGKRNLRDNEPILPPTETELNPTRSVLDALKEISRKRINSDVLELDNNDSTKKHCRESGDNISSYLQPYAVTKPPIASVLGSYTPTLKRIREGTSPPKGDLYKLSESEQILKRRMLAKNYDVLSSLSSSICMTAPKRKISIRSDNGSSDTSPTQPILKQQKCKDTNAIPYSNHLNMSTATSTITSNQKDYEIDSQNADDRHKDASSIARNVEIAAKPKLTLFNSNYAKTAPDRNKVQRTETKVVYSDDDDEVGARNISFITPKTNNSSTTVLSKNKESTSRQQNRLSIMLSCLNGDLNEDSVDSSKTEILISKTNPSPASCSIVKDQQEISEKKSDTNEISDDVSTTTAAVSLSTSSIVVTVAESKTTLTTTASTISFGTISSAKTSQTTPQFSFGTATLSAASNTKSNTPAVSSASLPTVEKTNMDSPADITNQSKSVKTPISVADPPNAAAVSVAPIASTTITATSVSTGLLALPVATSNISSPKDSNKALTLASGFSFNSPTAADSAKPKSPDMPASNFSFGTSTLSPPKSAASSIAAPGSFMFGNTAQIPSLGGFDFGSLSNKTNPIKFGTATATATTSESDKSQNNNSTIQNNTANQTSTTISQFPPTSTVSAPAIPTPTLPAMSSSTIFGAVLQNSANITTTSSTTNPTSVFSFGNNTKTAVQTNLFGKAGDTSSASAAVAPTFNMPTSTTTTTNSSISMQSSNKLWTASPPATTTSTATASPPSFGQTNSVITFGSVASNESQTSAVPTLFNFGSSALQRSVFSTPTTQTDTQNATNINSSIFGSVASLKSQNTSNVFGGGVTNGPTMITNRSQKPVSSIFTDLNQTTATNTSAPQFNMPQAAGSLTTNANASVPVTTTAASMFSFGAPSANPTSNSPFTFGANKPDPKPFHFGGSSSQAAADAAAKGTGFNFGASAPPTTNTDNRPNIFTFGNIAKSASAQPTAAAIGGSNNAGSTEKSIFTFGESKSNDSMFAAPKTDTSAAAAAASTNTGWGNTGTGGFTFNTSANKNIFGAVSNNNEAPPGAGTASSTFGNTFTFGSSSGMQSADPSKQPSLFGSSTAQSNDPKPFTFGASSPSISTNMFGSAMNAKPAIQSNSLFGSGASKDSQPFTFGAGTSTPVQPPNQNTASAAPFTFGAMQSNGIGGNKENSKPFTFGAPNPDQSTAVFGSMNNNNNNPMLNKPQMGMFTGPNPNATFGVPAPGTVNLFSIGTGGGNPGTPRGRPIRQARRTK